LYLREGDGFRTVATQNAPRAYVEARTRELIRPPPDGTLGRLAATKQVVHIADITTIASYLERNPFTVTPVELGGYRTVLAVPMLKDNELIGAITINRQEVCPFTDKQIDLLKSFAKQAVIAIENTRLLNELRQRTTDLTETLEQQTATAEVLQVISSSPGELDRVFASILANATRICEANFANLALVQGGEFRMVAMHGAPRAFEDLRLRRDPKIPMGGITPLGRLFETKRITHIADVTAEEPFASSAVAKVAGARTLVGVPMFKDNELIGAISIYRPEVRPFTDKQIELVTSFAHQAVIAIENARLLNELRESLEQQTATSEVLQVISTSPGELEPVFQAMLANATRICEAVFGNLYLCEADAFRMVAAHHDSPAYVEARMHNPLLRPPPDAPLGRLAITKQVVQVADIRTLPSRDHPFVAAGVKAGYRTVLAIPLRKDDELIGAFTFIRQKVQVFTDKQIALVQNFAAQAVIAIENTRLLNELRQRTTDLAESLEQQTATSEVLKVIAGSQGQLELVFSAMLENATRICGAKFGVLYLCEGEDTARAVAMHDAPQPFLEERRHNPLVRPAPGTTLGRVLATKQMVQIADILNDERYFDLPSGYNSSLLGKLAGARTILSVPMLKNEVLIGVITLYRQEVRPFTDKQIELVKNFAAQAVIAIENARLLNELRQRTTDLSESLEQQTATSEVLKVISSSPGELQPVFEAILANATRICQAKLGNLFLREANGYRNVALHGPPSRYAEWYQQEPVIDPRRHPTAPLAYLDRT